MQDIDVTGTMYAERELAAGSYWLRDLYVAFLAAYAEVPAVMGRRGGPHNASSKIMDPRKGAGQIGDIQTVLLGGQVGRHGLKGARK